MLPSRVSSARELCSDLMAFYQGADAVEIDLVPTSDGELGMLFKLCVRGYLTAKLSHQSLSVLLHDSELSRTTNIADHPEFASRQKTKSYEETNVTGVLKDLHIET
jgi:hypothetical protein